MQFSSKLTAKFHTQSADCDATSRVRLRLYWSHLACSQSVSRTEDGVFENRDCIHRIESNNFEDDVLSSRNAPVAGIIQEFVINVFSCGKNPQNRSDSEYTFSSAKILSEGGSEFICYLHSYSLILCLSS